MRLAEAKIKEAILHVDKPVRDVAIRYFAKPTTRDPSIMPQAILALEKYGRRQAFSFNHSLNRLSQTEATIAWCLGELSREFSGTLQDRYFYFMDLSRLLCYADIRLIIPHAVDILHASGFDPKARVGFQERLEMVGWDAAKCWDELHRFCEAEQDKEGIENFGYGHATRIIEALARQPHHYHDQIIDLLGKEARGPLKWLVPMMAYLAGEMKLRAAIPILVKNLSHPHSARCDHSLFALANMGGDDVLEAVCQPFLSGHRDYRLYASELLGKLHSDAAVEKILELLAHEEEFRVRLNLCEALLNHFSLEGLEPVRQQILKSQLVPDVRGLRSHLVATCTIMEARFPEWEQWREEARKDAVDEESKLKEVEAIAFEAQGDIKAFVQRMQEKVAATVLPGPLPRPLAPRRPAILRPGRVGRNDPCPCGSGKKYKQCCLRKT